MRKDVRERFLALGFDLELIKKFDEFSQTLTGLRGQNKDGLIQIGFTESEADIILKKVNRETISQSVLEAVITKCGGTCANCADGNNSKPYQIHHIEEYYKTQNNTEDNLLLLCPTCHSAIHKNKVSASEQFAKKQRWQNIWSVAITYTQKGISFPFGAFHSLYYGDSGSVLEIFSFASPKPSVCLSLLQPGVKSEIDTLLKKENKIILMGDSGSGKTTLAIGIAGIDSSFLVFMYSPTTESRNAVSEILLFLSTAVIPVTMIIDNANANLTTEQIDIILKAAEPRKRVVIVYTAFSAPNEKSLKHSFIDCIYPVNWGILKEGIYKNLLANENEVIRYLNDNKAGFAASRELGSGHLQMPLLNFIETFGIEVKTVWEFLFVISNGIERIDKIHLELVNDERTDIIVLFIGVHQISRVENGVSLDQIRQLYIDHSSLNNRQPPEKEWLRDKLSELIRKRIIKEERGRYNTIHRQFANNFLEHSYLKDKNATVELLNKIFNDFSRIREIIILWSWMQHTTARTYLRGWHQAFDKEKWEQLIEVALNDRLSTVSLLVDYLFMINTNGYEPLKQGFENKALEIAVLIDFKEAGSLYYLNKLFSGLHRNYTTLVQDVIHLMDEDLFIKTIKESDPTAFDSLLWLFNTLVEVDPYWVDKLSKRFSQDDFEVIIGKVKKGDINSLVDVINFHRRYIENIKRSQFKRYLNKICEVLRNCKLEEIQYGATSHTSGATLEIYFLPEEIAKILNCLNVPELSRGFEYCSPRDWGNILTLSLLSQSIKTDIITQIVDGIDVAKLEENIRRYTDQYFYELRLLLYQLCYGSSNKRKEFATMLKPILRDVFQDRNDDIGDVFKAYKRLHADIAGELYTELGLSFNINGEDSHKITPDSYREGRQQFELLEREGGDYEMQTMRFKMPGEQLSH